MCEVSGVSTFRSAAITILRKMSNSKRSESQYLCNGLALKLHAVKL